jgi:hypothetical protein
MQPPTPTTAKTSSLNLLLAPRLAGWTCLGLLHLSVGGLLSWSPSSSCTSISESLVVSGAPFLPLLAAGVGHGRRTRPTAATCLCARPYELAGSGSTWESGASTYRSPKKGIWGSTSPLILHYGVRPHIRLLCWLAHRLRSLCIILSALCSFDQC